MAKPYDTRLIMMVAQQSFETADMNQFCKLIPVVYVDGTRPAPADFPNDGEIWWMLTAQSERFADPGRLVTGTIEDAIRYDPHDPASSRYQVKRESVQDVELKDGMVLVDLPGDAVDNIQDVVSGDFRIEVAHQMPSGVLLRWRSNIYGPFIASSELQSRMLAFGQLSLSPANSDMTVYQVPATDFDEATHDHRAGICEEVSLTPNRRSEGHNLHNVALNLLLASGFERVLALNPQKIKLEPLEQKLLRFARHCLTRPKRQQLRRLLDDLQITGQEAQDAEELMDAIGRVRRVTEKQDVALDSVAKALLDTGLLGEERVANAEKAIAEKYVQERTAELQAKVEEQLNVRREELRRLDSEAKAIQANLQKEEAQRRAKLHKELAAEREKAEKKMAAEREEFQKQKRELERQQSLLQKNLEKVTRELREAGDEVVNRFLMISPLLGSLGLAHRQESEEPNDTSPRVPVHRDASNFELPAFVAGPISSMEESISEQAFFSRFRRVVEDNGYTYRLLDLQRFHISVKCGEMTILGGPSGTGKSSLPALYAKALLGAEADAGRPGCLMVNVNPSWMDTRDLLGHMNTLERRFYPAESGLFQHLVCAQEEYRTNRTTTGSYLICLDEMNLSQVEHYFSDFMMVLERDGGERAIQCFAPEVAGDDCPFRAWGRITISPAVRVVGTVNFDETTRLLSDRFLDRVNLIRLTSAGLPNAVEAATSPASTSGRMVTLADLDSWQTETALPPELGHLLDQMRPFLNVIGCPLSPRVYRAICRFVGSAGEIMPVVKAFDVQVAQRIAPKIRGLITSKQMNALDSLIQVMQRSSACSFDESMLLLEEARESAGSRGWDLEE